MKESLVRVNLTSRKQVEAAAKVLGVNFVGKREDIVAGILEHSYSEIKSAINQIKK